MTSRWRVALHGLGFGLAVLGSALAAFSLGALGTAWANGGSGLVRNLLWDVLGLVVGRV